MPPPTQAADPQTAEFQNLRDSYVPLFNGQPAEYKEYRKRLSLYHKKMLLSKRGGEAVLNIIGSFTGVVWRLFEDFPVEDCEKEDAFSKVLSRLDRNFEYDDRVLLPNDFENYFTNLQRKSQQSLLSFVTDHDEAYRKITGHKITLPSQVQGWHLLKRAGLTREQRQMVTLKAPTLEKANVIEALFLLYGQDYKAGGRSPDRRPQARWKGRGYAAFDEEPNESTWDDAYYEDEWYEAEEPYVPDYEDAAFDDEAIYYGGEDEFNDDYDGYDEDAASMAEAYDSAYATYMDARQRFQQLKLARGYLPVVALTDGQTAAASSSTSPTGRGKGHDKGRGKGKGKSKSKGKGSNTIRYPPSSGGKADPKGRAKAATASMTCLRCGQLGHWAASCPQNAKGSSSPSNKRPAPSSTTEGMAVASETALVLFQTFRMSMDKIIPKQRCWTLVLPLS